MLNFLTRALIVALLMPTMVCAMPVCETPEQEAPVSQTPHCADDPTQSTAEAFDSLMFSEDCSGFDIQAITSPLQFDPSGDSPHLDDYASLERWEMSTALNSQAQGIRGSPNTRSTTLSPHPTYFATQRIRL